MKDKLINALATEYEAVYLIDLERDTYETIKALKRSPAMLSSTHWSEAGEAFTEECSEDSRAIVRMFSDPQYLKESLMQEDYQECTFRHVTSDARWRKASVHVIERKDGVPKLVLLTASMIDKLAYQKERMFQDILSSNRENRKQEKETDNDLSVYKMLLSGETAEEGHNLYDGIKILLVEDNEILRLIAKETLENEGAIVTEAENGQQAVEAVKSGAVFDFIIMDIIMPVLDGISATREITEYQNSNENRIPILGLTSDATDEQRKKIIDAGAYACLSKPLNPQEMSKVFLSCMRERSALMEEKMAEINLLANTDMLTQAGNIVAYTKDTGKLSKEIDRLQKNVAIVVCDIDNLKGINDTYGHDVGDIYIKNSSALISDVFRKSPLYRVGGDEFALIVRGEDLSKIDARMKTLNDRSKQLSSVRDVIDGKASVSAGYAVYDPETDQSLSDTMKRADMAMYENKQLHRKWADAYVKLRR